MNNRAIPISKIHAAPAKLLNNISPGVSFANFWFKLGTETPGDMLFTNLAGAA